jgi:K+ transporter
VGTSPLYVFASIFTAPPSEADLVGATSLVIWSITALVLIKYAVIVLRADDHGQGARHPWLCSCTSNARIPSHTAALQCLSHISLGSHAPLCVC